MKKVWVGIVFLVFLFSTVRVGAAVNRIRGIATPTPVVEVQRTIQIVASPTPVITEAKKRSQLILVLPTTTPKPDRVGNLDLVGLGFGLEISKIGQERWLNPQPEPPIFDSVVVKKTEKRAILTWPVIYSVGNIKSEVEFGEEGAVVQIPETINDKKGKISLLIKPEFKVSGNKLTLLSDGKTVEVKTLPMVVYGRLKSLLAKNGIKLVGNLILEVKEGKAVYEIEIKEPVKLLGFIPMMVKGKVIINDDNGKVTISSKPWYAKISTSQADIIKDYELLPNLVVKEVRFEPAQYKEGDKVNVVVMVANESAAMAIGFPDIISHTGGPTEVLRFLDEGSFYKWYPIVVYFEPWQTIEMKDFYVDKVKCGQTVQYEIAKSDTSFVEETTKEDNFKSVKLECGQ